jgi:hypothetical protein
VQLIPAQRLNYTYEAPLPGDPSSLAGPADDEESDQEPDPDADPSAAPPRSPRPPRPVVVGGPPGLVITPAVALAARQAERNVSMTSWVVAAVEIANLTGLEAASAGWKATRAGRCGGRDGCRLAGLP